VSNDAENLNAAARTAGKPTRSARRLTRAELGSIYQRLLRHFGPQAWWPAKSCFEVIVGAVLTQNTNWRNVELALQRLRDRGALELQNLSAMSLEETAELIRPAGYFRLKAQRLHNLLQYIVTHHNGSLDAMFALDPQALRADLLQIRGIGPETADSILLYAGQKPQFVVDAYTVRLLVRHGWINPRLNYHDVQQFLTRRLPTEVAMFNEFHALIVRLGKEHCRKQPHCDGCPLADFLPGAGPCPDA
jgi:endonuclease-3 related protein